MAANQGSGQFERAVLGIVWAQGPVTAQEVHARLGALEHKLDSVRGCLAALAKEGRIERVDRNRYASTEGPDAPPASDSV